MFGSARETSLVTTLPKNFSLRNDQAADWNATFGKSFLRFRKSKA